MTQVPYELATGDKRLSPSHMILRNLHLQNYNDATRYAQLKWKYALLSCLTCPPFMYSINLFCKTVEEKAVTIRITQGIGQLPQWYNQ